MTLLPLLTAFFALGVAVARLLVVPVTGVMLLVLLTAASAAFLFVRHRFTALTVLLLLLFLLLGAASLELAEKQTHDHLAPWLGKEVLLTGFVQEVGATQQ